MLAEQQPSRFFEPVLPQQQNDHANQCPLRGVPARKLYSMLSASLVSRLLRRLNRTLRVTIFVRMCETLRRWLASGFEMPRSL